MRWQSGSRINIRGLVCATRTHTYTQTAPSPITSLKCLRVPLPSDLLSDLAAGREHTCKRIHTNSPQRHLLNRRKRSILDAADKTRVGPNAKPHSSTRRRKRRVPVSVVTAGYSPKSLSRTSTFFFASVSEQRVRGREDG